MPPKPETRCQCKGTLCACYRCPNKMTHEDLFCDECRDTDNHCHIFRYPVLLDGLTVIQWDFYADESWPMCLSHDKATVIRLYRGVAREGCPGPSRDYPARPRPMGIFEFPPYVMEG